LKDKIEKRLIFSVTLLTAALFFGNHSISALDNIPEAHQTPENADVVVEKIAPEGSHGQGYKLVYRVNVPIAVFWRFKTDFDNSFLVESDFIRDHRLITQDGHIAITENKYSYGPDVSFRWQTKMFPDHYRLEFVLLNPNQCKQKYHHGTIQLASEGDVTRVTQVAYFDFWGASFWVHYPWKGGMKDVLSNKARWEQETAVRLKDRYDE
jgi:hypothetical protein